MIRVLLLAFSVLAFSSSAFAQPEAGEPTPGEILKKRCGGTGNHSHAKIFGCLDWPPNRVTVTASHELLIIGWALHVETWQQPSDITVLQFGMVNGQRQMETLPREAYTVYWRLPRYDVLAWARTVSGIRSPHLGYAVVIRAGVLREGPNNVIVRFTEPTAENALGVNYQEVQITVVP